MLCYFVTDLHGGIDKYKRLFGLINTEQPDAIFIGGDILPGGSALSSNLEQAYGNFIGDFLEVELTQLRNRLGDRYPNIYIILGNDDGRACEEAVLEMESRKLWIYAHNKRIDFNEFSVYGYAYVPPTPFFLKDWERYDVSRYVEHGTISPERGQYTHPTSDYDKKYATIDKDIKKLIGDDNLENSIFLFHSPPYQTKLDRTDRDDIKIDHAPVDVHVGSIAIKRFIEKHQPMLTLHGHIHESTRLTGSWNEKIGKTYCFNAAHDGPELSLIRFDPTNLENANRELL